LNPREGNLLCARKLPQNGRRVNRMCYAESIACLGIAAPQVCGGASSALPRSDQ
jgi:hypothetical protein